MVDKRLQDRILDILLHHHPARVSIFGSFARGEATNESDLDVLIQFKSKIGLLKLVQIQQELTDALGVSVDLLTENSLKNPRLRESIHADLITIYNEEGQPSLS